MRKLLTAFLIVLGASGFCATTTKNISQYQEETSPSQNGHYLLLDTGTTYKKVKPVNLISQTTGNLTILGGLNVGTATGAGTGQVKIKNTSNSNLVTVLNLQNGGIGTGTGAGILFYDSNGYINSLFDVSGWNLKLSATGTEGLSIRGTDVYIPNGGINLGSGAGATTGNIVATEMYSKTVGGTNRDLYIDNTGVIGYVSSALRYKDNIRSLDDKSSKIYQLNPVLFDYKNKNQGINKFGLIADEVETVLPEICSYNDIKDPSGNVLSREIETVSYGDLIPLLLNEIKKLNDRIKILEGR